jgi:CRP-like cAMP-binding protein
MELAYPVLILHVVLLPLNIVRLRQMQRLIEKVDKATGDDSNFKWVKPFTSTLTVEAGETVFHKGEPADEMFFIVSGRFEVKERDVGLRVGDVFGELGLLSPTQARTASVVCIEGGQLLRITYDQVKQLYLEDPQFGFYLLHLVSRRLFENLSRESALPQQVRGG